MLGHDLAVMHVVVMQGSDRCGSYACCDVHDDQAVRAHIVPHLTHFAVRYNHHCNLDYPNDIIQNPFVRVERRNRTKTVPSKEKYCYNLQYNPRPQ